jgi:hypothetical protein
MHHLLPCLPFPTLSLHRYSLTPFRHQPSNQRPLTSLTLPSEGWSFSPQFARLLHFKYTLEQTFETTEKWDRIAAMIVADGGGTYTGQALRRKFRNLVEGGLQTLQNPDAEEGVGAGQGGLGEEGEDGASALGSLDDLDRELMGVDDDPDGDGDGEADEEETPSKKTKEERRRFVVVEERGVDETL